MIKKGEFEITQKSENKVFQDDDEVPELQT
jgi:hypothetical protein